MEKVVVETGTPLNVVSVKLFQGGEGVYFKPPAKSRFKSFWRQHRHILRKLIIKL